MPEEAATLTTYQMFQSRDDGKTWDHVGAQESTGRDSALNAFFAAPEEGVQYAAVADIHWRPHALQVKRVLMALLPVGEGVPEPTVDPDEERNQLDGPPQGALALAGTDAA